MKDRIELRSNLNSRYRGMYKFLHNKMAVISVLILLCLILISIFAPILAPYDFESTDLFSMNQKPSQSHILGTDHVGRDILTRLLYGGRASLMVGISAMAVQLFFGTLLGTISGYYGGVIDYILSHIADAIMCFPFFVIALSVVSVVGTGTLKMVIMIGCLMWPNLFRIVRAEVKGMKDSDYIMAARAMGISSKEIIMKHVINNIISPVLVAATLAVAHGIIMESALSFLGMGVQPPMASWGNMLSDARNMSTLIKNWWMWMPAGFMVTITVLSINSIGEGLRDALDPREYA